MPRIKFVSDDLRPSSPVKSHNPYGTRHQVSLKEIENTDFAWLDREFDLSYFMYRHPDKAEIQKWFLELEWNESIVTDIGTKDRFRKFLVSFVTSPALSGVVCFGDTPKEGADLVNEICSRRALGLFLLVQHDKDEEDARSCIQSCVAYLKNENGRRSIEDCFFVQQTLSCLLNLIYTQIEGRHTDNPLFAHHVGYEIETIARNLRHLQNIMQSLLEVAEFLNGHTKEGSVYHHILHKMDQNNTLLFFLQQLKSESLPSDVHQSLSSDFVSKWENHWDGYNAASRSMMCYRGELAFKSFLKRFKEGTPRLFSGRAAPWTHEEERRMVEVIKGYPATFDWKDVAENVQTKHADECCRHWYELCKEYLLSDARSPESGHPWTLRDDFELQKYALDTQGIDWSLMPVLVPFSSYRNPLECCVRWSKYGQVRGEDIGTNWTAEEDQALRQAVW
eukprot:CAMPEP_0113879064 /NCGR_PEP_ID=MMETSP0780_2-20120614/7028_1 /TAXON_ID=652834 /ORGANISM="Palpitomonas bilix" /LENGTH=448 /DNA_ID=CAMNT_0000865599 /DNA_START=404 /DNA_END=1747 /DNA_ORIENTATION=+ /assembly_acc=CAM_ASM_000599